MPNQMIGMLRVKNEARWISQVLQSIQPLCDPIFVFDDHSSDATRDICREHGAYVIPSQFEGLDEARDKEYLLKHFIIPVDPEVVIAIDGDEVLTPDSLPCIEAAASRQNVSHCSFRVLYLWDREDQIRTDGVYRNFRRSSLFRVKGQDHAALTFQPTSHGGNFHCKNIPQGLRGMGVSINATLLHYGYLHREDRIRKYEWYRSKDPNSIAEDGYRHVVQGDVAEIPAEMKLKHAGPLRLQSL